MGKTKFSRKNGKVHVHGHKYEQLEGTRAQVWHGTAFKTSGDLTKKNLMKNKHGRIVSRKLHTRAKREKRLEKAGYKTKKGEFGSFKINGKKHRKHSKHSKKHRGGSNDMGSHINQRTDTMGQNLENRANQNGGNKQRGGMSGLNPASYDGKSVGTSGAQLQLVATNY